MRMGMRQKFDTRWVGYGDEDECFLWGCVWDSETRPCPVLLPSLDPSVYTLFFCFFVLFQIFVE